jgi:hypothetical protein
LHSKVTLAGAGVYGRVFKPCKVLVYMAIAGGFFGSMKCCRLRRSCMNREAIEGALQLDE